MIDPGHVVALSGVLHAPSSEGQHMIKNHKADSFDAGRAASIADDVDPVSVPELTRKIRPGANARTDDNDVHALLQAVLALAGHD